VKEYFEEEMFPNMRDRRNTGTWCISDSRRKSSADKTLGICANFRLVLIVPEVPPCIFGFSFLSAPVLAC
jgi:hypothetical protein